MVKDNSENVEDKILDAAADEFEEKGFAGARMQQIADRAGINKALLHYYFRSKEKLFEKVFLILAKRVFMKSASVLTGDMSVFEKIEVFFDMHQQLLWKNRNFPIFFLNEIYQNPELIKKVLDNIDLSSLLSGFIEQIDREKDEGIIRQDIDSASFLVDVVSLSIFPYLGQPILIEIMARVNMDYNTFLQQRRKQVAQFVINSIKA